ncbi:MAG: DnaB-like helicase C-terminal domain-containing protein, partial [Anaerolineae bacterium]
LGRILSTGLTADALTDDALRRVYQVASDAYLSDGVLTRAELASALRRSSLFSPKETEVLERALTAERPRVDGDPVRAARSVLRLYRVRKGREEVERWLALSKVRAEEAYRRMGELATSLISVLDGGGGETGVASDILDDESGYSTLYAISTGIPALDRALSVAGDAIPGGFRPGELWTIGMPSSHGKSSTASFFTAQMVRRGLGVVVFELEMGAEALLYRAICSLAGIPLDASIVPDRCSPEEREARAEAVKALSTYARVYGNAREASEMELRVRIASSTLPSPPALVIVDHIGVMDPGGQNQAKEWRYLEEFSMSLKRIAQRYRVTCVAFAQLSAAQEDEFAQRNTIVGQLRFRGSAGIFHASDVAIVAGRHNGIVNGMPDLSMRNVSVWTVKKNRLTGETSRFALRYDPRTFTYLEEIPYEGI